MTEEQTPPLTIKLAQCPNLKVICTKETECENKRAGQQFECVLAFNDLIPTTDALIVMESKLKNALEFAVYAQDKFSGLPDMQNYYKACSATLTHVINNLIVLRNTRDNNGDTAHPCSCDSCDHKTKITSDSGMCGCSKLNRNISWQQWCILREAGCGSYSGKPKPTMCEVPIPKESEEEKDFW